MKITFTRPTFALKQLQYSFRHVVILVAAVFTLLVFYLVSTSRGHVPIGAEWDDRVAEQGPGHTHGPAVYYGQEMIGKPKVPTTSSEEWSRRAEQVKKAFVHAYSNYERYAFPHDELLPLTNGSKNNFNGWGVTTFDSLDTMLLMGLTDEFNEALQFVSQANFSMQRTVTSTVYMNMQISFFETIIRYLGGLLSAYALSHEPVLLQKAEELADAMSLAFSTGSGLPAAGFSGLSGKVGSLVGTGMLAEVASCQLEYAYLAQLTGKKKHYLRSERIFDALRRVNLSETGMLPMRFNLASGITTDKSVSVGAGADSGHEYLLKYYLLTGQKDSSSIDMYMRTVNHILTKLLYLSPRRSLLYVVAVTGYNGLPSSRFEHLSCFLPGLLALGVHTLPPSVFANAHSTFTPSQAPLLSSFNMRDLHMSAAVGLGESCWQMYADQPTGLGPEDVNMVPPTVNVHGKSFTAESGLWIEAMNNWRISNKGGVAPGVEEKVPERQKQKRDYTLPRTEYFLRPETVESMYVLWKATGDERWRDRGWAIFKAIEKEAKTPFGYASLQSVEVSPAVLINDMPSFFLAETLKYLYLLFSNEDPVPLDKWVFNTEAHPLPIFTWTSSDKIKFGIP